MVFGSRAGHRWPWIAPWVLGIVVGCASASGPDSIDTEGPQLGSASGSRSDTVVPIDSADSGSPTPVCGNGEVEADEECDDGNDDDADTCTTECTVPTCDDGLQDRDESDVDCGGECAPCSVGGGCSDGADCQTEICIDDRCAYPVSCRDRLEQVPDATDGVVTIDPDGDGGVEPFGVSCDMSTDGGGWIRLSMQNSDGVVVGQRGADNPWHKCADDGATHFAWIDEGTISADFSPGVNFDEEVALSYQNPADGTVYEVAEVDALRSVVSEINAATRMVALTADDDDLDYHGNPDEGGHEVYVRSEPDTWVLLTPGTNGDCGGSSDFPAAGSESAFYLWTHEATNSVVDGDTTVDDDALSGVDEDVVLPAAVRLVVQSGGGVAFGWEQTVFLVR